MKVIKCLFILFVLSAGLYLFYKYVILRDLENNVSRSSINYESIDGYAPYKFSIHKGWVPDKRYGFPAFRKKFSGGLPRSIFQIQVQEAKSIIGDDSVSLKDYVDNYLIPELNKEHNAKISSKKDYTINNLSAISLIYTYPLTLQNVTRSVKNHTIIFIIHGYIYTLDLGSFKKDFDVANKEFELMVGSFHFER